MRVALLLGGQICLSGVKWMDIGLILLVALFLAIPVAVKYALAFETKSLIDQLRKQEEEVKYMAVQLRALEREKIVARRAMRHVRGQHQQAEVRRSMISEKLERTRYLADNQLVAT